MAFKTYPFHTFSHYFSVDIMAVYHGKWIFCMHKNRTTWEHPSGWIEADETPLEAARRELFEETGAVYFAIVHTLNELPSYSEMGKIGFFDTLPDKLTYPILRDYFPIAVKKQQAMAGEK